MISIQFKGSSQVPKDLSEANHSKKSFTLRPMDIKSGNGEIKKDRWNSHLCSEIDGNCILVDGLGAI